MPCGWQPLACARRNSIERRMIAGTSLAPFQKCVAPGTRSSARRAAPAASSASASRTLSAPPGHQVINRPVDEKDRRRARMGVGHRAGLPGQVGH